MDNQAPHVWCTTDNEEHELFHLAMTAEGAVKCHLMHYSGNATVLAVEATDQGKLSVTAGRNRLCFGPTCILVGLSDVKERTMDANDLLLSDYVKAGVELFRMGYSLYQDEMRENTYFLTHTNYEPVKIKEPSFEKATIRAWEIVKQEEGIK
jgi:hypothetical protein